MAENNESGRALVARMVSEAEAQIKNTEELIDIMALAGEDVTEEKLALSQLKERVARYRAALSTVA